GVVTDRDVRALTGSERQIDGAVLRDDTVTEISARRQRSGRRALGRIRKRDRWLPRLATVERSRDVRAAEAEEDAGEPAAHGGVDDVGIALHQVLQLLRRRTGEDVGVVEQDRKRLGGQPRVAFVVAVLDERLWTPKRRCAAG